MKFFSHIGSSPHGRGTGFCSYVHNICKRFIPAWAGNSRTQMCVCSLVQVHPRMGGEQEVFTNYLKKLLGSSPHGRGTGVRSTRVQGMVRFIPAWAGNRDGPIWR